MNSTNTIIRDSLQHILRRLKLIQTSSLMANSSVFLVLAAAFMVLSLASGKQFKVGGSGNWSLLDNNAMSYNQWAEKNRFQIGDSIVFVYLPDEDSVFLVDDDAYKSCNASSYIDHFNDGNTVFTFTHSGNFYFVSGVKDNCDKNEKLHVVVLADRKNKSSPAPAPLPASPPAEGATEQPSPPANAADAKVVGVVSSLGAAAIAAFSFTF